MPEVPWTGRAKVVWEPYGVAGRGAQRAHAAGSARGTGRRLGKEVMSAPNAGMVWPGRGGVAPMEHPGEARGAAGTPSPARGVPHGHNRSHGAPLKHATFNKAKQAHPLVGEMVGSAPGVCQGPGAKNEVDGREGVNCV